MAGRNLAQYCSLYGETAVAELAAAGPVILLLEQVNEPALRSICSIQRRTGAGWAACPAATVRSGPTLARSPGGRRDGSPGLYRFDDNRTLACALARLPNAQWPAFLGPLVSVCYWHAGHWCQSENPMPAVSGPILYLG